MMARTALNFWKSDGSSTGTVLVKDITPGSSTSGSANVGPTFLTNVNGSLYFTAWDTVSGQELWKSDGTAAGTVQVMDINPVQAQALLRRWPISTELFCFKPTMNEGNRIVKSDGSTAGTTIVLDSSTGTGSSSPRLLTSLGSSLLFGAIDPVASNSLWKSDGTAVGTALVKDIDPQVTWVTPNLVTPVGGVVSLLLPKQRLARSYGKAMAPQPVRSWLRDIVTGPTGGYPYQTGQVSARSTS